MYPIPGRVQFRPALVSRVGRVFAATLVAVLGASAAQAQDVHPEFEAASIKLNTSESGSSSTNGSKGQVVFTNVSLKRLIERAYEVKPFQVTCPGWAENVKFDIAAKYPPDTKSADRVLMLRTLLEQRFKLAVHRESKEMPGYALVVAKGGSKLQPVEAGGSSTSTNGGRVLTLTAKKTSMGQLADLLARDLSVMVVDQTGMDGVYDFDLRWSNEERNTGDDAEPAPSLFTAVQEKLGLRLQSQKVPVPVIVVDHVERMPVEN